MREKLETLPLAQLRDLAKSCGMKGVSTMKKAELIDALVLEDEKRRGVNTASAPAKAVKTEEKKTEDAPVKAEEEPAKAQSKPETVEKSEAPAQEKTERRSAPSEQRREQRRGNNHRETVVYRGDSPTSKNYEKNAAQAQSIPQNQSAAQEQPQNTAQPQNEPQNQNAEASASAQQIPDYMIGAVPVKGILEVLQEGFGFIRSENFLPGESDIYVSPAQIHRFNLRTGDILTGMRKAKSAAEKFSPLVHLSSINGYDPNEAAKRINFQDLTPIFPDKRLSLERPGCSIAMRAMDLVSPVGMGQRGMIVSPPKAGKTSLLKEVAKSVLYGYPHMHMLILLIDERPEEVTDIKEAISGENVEVIYSTFDETPEHHIRVAEMVIERAKRLVEHKQDVVILLDSITRLTRAYNQVIPPSGRTLSGGLDPAALHMPKRFFGAARNMREGGSLTILATALVETGSKMDDVVYEEFKGTGNMEIVLDRKLSEKRIFPAIDLAKSGTRREDLLLTKEELDAIGNMRKALNSMKPEEATDRILDMFAKTRNNFEFVNMVLKSKLF